jgi:hypothetical protein
VVTAEDDGTATTVTELPYLRETALWGVGLSLAAAVAAFGTWRYRRSWENCWQPSLGVTCVALAPLFLADGLPQWRRLVTHDDTPYVTAFWGHSTRSAAVVHYLPVHHPKKQALELLESWAEREGYAFYNTLGYKLVRSPARPSDPHATIRWLEAHQPLPLSRWEVTWRGPRLRRPQLAFALSGDWPTDEFVPAPVHLAVVAGVFEKSSAAEAVLRPLFAGLDRALAPPSNNAAVTESPLRNPASTPPADGGRRMVNPATTRSK